MGLTLQFLLGNVAEIENAIVSVDLEWLYDPSVIIKQADISLHIIPKDLDLLSRQLGVVSALDSMDLRPHMKVIFDEKDRGLLAVDKAWVEYASTLSEDNIPDVAEKWATAMQLEYDDDKICVTSDMLQSIHELIDLCRTANNSGMQVLHAWFL